MMVNAGTAVAVLNADEVEAVADHAASFDLPEAVALHIELMRYLGETRYGVFDRKPIKSALARSRQAAAYEQADLIAQAATLLYGLIKNHPWVGGNKRTATFLTDSFLNRNGLFVELALAVEADHWQTAEIAAWLLAFHEGPVVWPAISVLRRLWKIARWYNGVDC